MAYYKCLPGSKNGGYLRHRDAFKQSYYAPNSRMRKLTLISYINTPNVDAKHRGCLRLFPKKDEIIDIVPIQGRSIIFLSETLEHQVLPIDATSMKNNTYQEVSRFALTMWFNHIVPQEQNNEKIIFVGIPCYRDNELLPTLKSIIEQAN